MASDSRQVVLLKSKLTLNRFYTLAPPERGWKNAEEIEDFPNDVLLGIAYPCLEDGLNDFAVIRSTFETIDSFPDDDDLRTDLMVMVQEARETLVRRLSELRDRLASRQAHFLGTNLNEFKEYSINLVQKGNQRRTLDNMMKLDVFTSVAATEAAEKEAEPEANYHYDFLPENALTVTRNFPPLDFVVRLFDDVLASAGDDANLVSKYTFDRHVFQKFIGLMFINYATTDPIFYGTRREDYEVSADRDMTQTPLYKAVAEALREIERQLAENPDAPEEEITQATIHEKPDYTQFFGEEDSDEPEAVLPLGNDAALPGESNEGLVFASADAPSPPDEAAIPSVDENNLLMPPTPGTSATVGLNPFKGTAPAAPPVPPAPPVQASAPSRGDEGNGSRSSLPDAKTAQQRLMVPLNSILMASQLLKTSTDPNAAMYSQMILTSVEALQAALKEWGIVE